jgi:hypothetical protein
MEDAIGGSAGDEQQYGYLREAQDEQRRLRDGSENARAVHICLAPDEQVLFNGLHLVHELKDSGGQLLTVAAKIGKLRECRPRPSELDSAPEQREQGADGGLKRSNSRLLPGVISGETPKALQLWFDARDCCRVGLEQGFLADDQLGALAGFHIAQLGG